MAEGPDEAPRASESPASPLPEPILIPFQLIESWLGIPAHDYVEVQLTRGDFDRIYGFVNKSYQSQGTFQQVMIDYSNGRLAEANKAMHEAQRLLIEGQNELRQFMAAVMASGLRNRGRHGG
jgi:hypothetical protein